MNIVKKGYPLIMIGIGILLLIWAVLGYTNVVQKCASESLSDNFGNILVLVKVLIGFMLISLGLGNYIGRCAP